MSRPISIPRKVDEKTFPSGKIKISMGKLPDDWHERVFGKKEELENIVESKNGIVTTLRIKK